MRHVIIIESTDNINENSDEVTDERGISFQDACITVVQALANNYLGESFIQSQFFVTSAVVAVQEMYGIHE